mmetsp:Transcript_11102/g.14959  ORF Transcript_11102/g.14959 Transcript_11102/m.14959 type:complete len:88 (+) Transcript_11102:965-1228(+)
MVGNFASNQTEDAQKAAEKIIAEARYEDLGGLDSSIDEDELEEELRDRVEGSNQKAAKEGSDEEEISKNIDLTYYNSMNVDEKIVTL